MLAATLATTLPLAICLSAAQSGDAAAPGGTIEVPTTRQAGWQVLRYQGIPMHAVDFTNDGLVIRVRRSASPVIYELPEPVHAGALLVRGRVEGTLEVPPGAQGADGFDDYVLRAGVVLAGSRRPGFFERTFAPPWLKTLFTLAPAGSGISEVRFFNVAADGDHVGDERRHPSNDLLVEHVVTIPGVDGAFELNVSIDTSEQTVALWLNSDGDDTGSEFVVLVERIAFTAAPLRRNIKGEALD